MMFFANGALLSFFLLLALEIIISCAALEKQTQYSDISVGSSLSANGESSWLSSSGRFSFGFYPEPKGEGFSVGIQLLFNATNTMVVWKAVGDPKPFSKNAFLNFTADGLFVTSGRGRVTDLITFPSPPSSASMLDNGNFVVYNSNSTNSTATQSTANVSTSITWRSFDHPTDTILGNQVLSCGRNLTTFGATAAEPYSLAMQCDGNLVLYNNVFSNVIWSSRTPGEFYNSLVLDAHGSLYLSSLTGGTAKDISPYKSQNVNKKMIYAARVESNGIFRLYEVDLDANTSLAVNDIPYYQDSCQAEDTCGIDSYCKLAYGKPNCTCLPGFDYIDPNNQAAGCQRILELTGRCDSNLSVMFMAESVVGMDDLAYGEIAAASTDECSRYCGNDCNCYAAFFRVQRCFKLKVPLSGMRLDQNDPGVAFVKLAVAPSRVKKTNVMGIVVSAVITGVFCLSGIAASGGAYWLLISRFREKWKKWEIALAEEIVPRYYSYEEIVNSPSWKKGDKLGVGSQGRVYKLILPVKGSHEVVAVKHLHGGEIEAEKDFQVEMSLIGRARHRNLVRILGFCQDSLNRILVYEFMNRGSLAELIFACKSLRPSWARLVEMLLGAARGIQYLHDECETKIIHRDIKPENILISHEWEAKISDFGIAKLMIASQRRAATWTMAAGTDGYIAPECELLGDATGAVMLTEKADVYSYGVVVLETVFGKRNREAKLCELARARLDAGELWMLFDGEEAEVRWELERAAKIGILCVQRDPEARPSMEEVVMMLEGGMVVPNPAPLSLSRHFL